MWSKEIGRDISPDASNSASIDISIRGRFIDVPQPQLIDVPAT